MSGATQGRHGLAYGPAGPNGNAGSNQVARLLSKGLAYKFNTPDAGNMYLLTTEAIVTYVSENYGVDMMNLVKYGKEKTFTKPGTKGSGTAPTTCSKDKDGLAVYDVDNDTYKIELGFYMKQKDTYEENKGKVFGLVMLCCHDVTKTRLESDEDFAELEQNSDVVSVLKLLKTLAFSIGESGDPYAVLLGGLKLMIGINQGPNESVANYYRRFLAQSSVLETQWGLFYLTAVVNNDPSITSKLQEIVS